MSQNSNTRLVNNTKEVSEEKDNLSFIKNTLPSRRSQRSITRQSLELQRLKEKEELKKEQNHLNSDLNKELVQQEFKQDVIEEFSQDIQDNTIDNQLENPNEKSIDELNTNTFNSKKAISNIKHVVKKNRAGIVCVGLAIVVAILVIMIFLVFSKDDKDNSMAKYLDTMRSQDVVECDIEQINFFFKAYYEALSGGNTTVLEGLYDDSSKVNITTEVSQIVESFNNIKVYVTKGLKDKEIVAFVYNELKFPNINTLAPAIDTYYLRYEPADNSLKIMASMYTDASIIKYINVVAKKDPVRSLLFDTNEKLNTALDSDKELKNLYLIMQSMTDNDESKTTTQ